ncbi:MAG: aminoacyl-tRNA hydrolase, partial [Trueperaceae bacterium]
GGGRAPAAEEFSLDADGVPVKLIVGLGNPGESYRRTRHNAGYLVMDELARRHGLKFRKARGGDSSRLGGVTLLKPTTYMNGSGRAVQAAAGAARARSEQILVVHDDLDLPLGKLRFKRGGGAGGQRGVQDTIARIGPDFWRLKLGISRPPPGWQVENWVLSRFREEEQELVGRVVTAAADSVELLLSSDIDTAMNSTNGLDLAAPTEPRGSAD